MNLVNERASLTWTTVEDMMTMCKMLRWDLGFVFRRVLVFWRGELPLASLWRCFVVKYVILRYVTCLLRLQNTFSLGDDSFIAQMICTTGVDPKIQACHSSRKYVQIQRHLLERSDTTKSNLYLPYCCTKPEPPPAMSALLPSLQTFLRAAIIMIEPR